ncbi:MAG: rhodanese-like domain-containing protein [Gemmatimonadaceae bacterium]
MFTRLAAISTALALTFPNGGVPLRTCAAQPEASETSETPLLVTSGWLKGHLHDKNLVLLHVGDPREFDKAHLPGARNATLRDFSDPDMAGNGGLMLQMPASEVLREKLQALGISNNSQIVIYAAQQWFSPATRVLLTMDYVGLGDRAVLLDGGLEGWTKAGGPVETGASATPSRGSLTALNIRPFIVDAAYVNAHIGKPGFSIVDGRDRVFYDGVSVGGGRAAPMPPHLKGHIASAKSLPFSEIWTDTSFAKSPAEIRELFAKAGVAPTDTVIAYCHIGQQATSVVFGARLIGQPVLFYDGSFEDWSKQPNARVEVPAKP